MSSDRIRELNDRLRQFFAGGRMVVTRGVAALPVDFHADVLTAVRAFSGFTEDNDPHSEHDCAILTVRGERFMFKIDYFDPTLSFASADPADPSKTARILTILRAEEY